MSTCTLRALRAVQYCILQAARLEGILILKQIRTGKICAEIGRESQDDGEVSGCPGN